MAIAEKVFERGIRIPKDHTISRLEPKVHVRGNQIAMLDGQLHGLRVLLKNNFLSKEDYKTTKIPLLVQRRELSAQQTHDRIELRRAKRAKEKRKSPFR